MQTSIPRYQDATHSSPSNVLAADSLTTHGSHTESKIGDFLGPKVTEDSSPTGEVKRLVAEIEEKLNRQKVHQQIVKGTPRIFPGYRIPSDLKSTKNPLHSNIADLYPEDSKVLDTTNPSLSSSSDTSEIDSDDLTMEQIYPEDSNLIESKNLLRSHTSDTSATLKVSTDHYDMGQIYPEKLETTMEKNPLKNPNESESFHLEKRSLKRGDLVIGDKVYSRESLNPDIAHTDRNEGATNTDEAPPAGGRPRGRLPLISP
jgi:hypothetical protein